MPDPLALHLMPSAARFQPTSNLVSTRGAVHEKVPIAQVLATPFDARLYGVIGDGTTDNSAFIQAALNASAVAGSRSVYLPAGTFQITTALTVPAGVTLRCDRSIIRRSGVASG